MRLFDSIHGRFFEVPGKYRWPALAVLVCLALVTLYVLDAWLLDTAAAYVMVLASSLKHFPSPPDTSIVSWYWHHQLFVARAWLFAGDKLSNPEIRTCWLFLNGGLAILALVGTISVRLYIPGTGAVVETGGAP